MRHIEDRIDEMPEPAQSVCRAALVACFLIMVIGMAWLSFFL